MRRAREGRGVAQGTNVRDFGPHGMHAVIRPKAASETCKEKPLLGGVVAASKVAQVALRDRVVDTLFRALPVTMGRGGLGEVLGDSLGEALAQSFGL